MKEWFFKTGLQQYGPYTAAKMRQFVEQGHINHETLIRRGENGQWISASRVEGLLTPVDIPPVIKNNGTARRKPILKRAQIISIGVSLVVFGVGFGIFATFLFGPDESPVSLETSVDPLKQEAKERTQQLLFDRGTLLDEKARLEWLDKRDSEIDWEAVESWDSLQRQTKIVGDLESGVRMIRIEDPNPDPAPELPEPPSFFTGKLGTIKSEDERQKQAKLEADIIYKSSILTTHQIKQLRIARAERQRKLNLYIKSFNERAEEFNEWIETNQITTHKPINSIPHPVKLNED